MIANNYLTRNYFKTRNCQNLYCKTFQREYFNNVDLCLIKLIVDLTTCLSAG